MNSQGTISSRGSQLKFAPAVQVRVVDQTLPTDRRPRLLKVNPHDNAQILAHAVLLHILLELRGVLFGGFNVVDRAGPDNDNQAVVLALDNRLGFPTGSGDGLGRSSGKREVLHENFCSGEFEREDGGAVRRVAADTAGGCDPYAAGSGA